MITEKNVYKIEFHHTLTTNPKKKTVHIAAQEIGHAVYILNNRAYELTGYYELEITSIEKLPFSVIVE